MFRRFSRFPHCRRFLFCFFLRFHLPRGFAQDCFRRCRFFLSQRLLCCLFQMFFARLRARVCACLSAVRPRSRRKVRQAERAFPCRERNRRFPIWKPPDWLRRVYRQVRFASSRVACANCIRNFRNRSSRSLLFFLSLLYRKRGKIPTNYDRTFPTVGWKRVLTLKGDCVTIYAEVQIC